MSGPLGCGRRSAAGAHRFLTVLAVALVGAVAAGAAPASVSAKATTGAWQLLPPAPINLGQAGEMSVWTGRNVLYVSSDAQSGAAFDPTGGRWRNLPAGLAPTGAAQGGSFGVWTGRELLVSGFANTAYNPATDRWRRLPPPSNFGGMPAAVAWTGSQMIQWGGGCCGEFSAAGSAYTPATNTWRELPASPLAGRREAALAWTGRELVIAGGYTETPVGPRHVITSRVLADAAAYNPTTRSWRRLPPLPVPRTGATTAWDGREVLVVGGSTRPYPSGRPLAGVFAYRPSTNRWQRLPSLPRGRDEHLALWTGTRLLVWGGRTVRNGRIVWPRTGLSFDPAADRWSPLLPGAPLSGRISPMGVWTGTSMIVAEGFSPVCCSPLNDAASYRPPRSDPGRPVVPPVAG